MWALRRVSLPLRHKNGFRIGISHSHSDSEFPTNHIQCQTGKFKCSQLVVPDDKCASSKRFYCREPVCGNALAKREFSSEFGAKGTEGELEGGFSELEASDNSEAESDNGDDEVEPSQWEKPTSALFRAITEAEGLSVRDAVDRWVAEGNEFTHEEIFLTVRSFRRLRMIKKALELLEYLEGNDRFEFDESSYATCVDLVAKVYGLKKAEDYIQKIPDSYRGEKVYRSLLAYCVRASHVKKAQEVFQKMRDLGFPVTLFSCNQMIFLYKRYDKKKVADVLQLMEKENVKPSLITYKQLMAIKAQFKDTKGMEAILETMKSEGIEPDTQARFITARHYALCGLKDKAEALLKEMEGSDLNDNRQVCRSLFLLYAELGKADEVERVWKVCEADPHFVECLAAMDAWGKLGKVDEAEAVFNRMSKIWKKPSNKQYVALLKVYANNKELEKGRDLVQRMSDDGYRIGPLSWNGLVKLHVEAGEVEKAESILMKFAQQSPIKPLPRSYMFIMKEYAKRGDIHGSERIFNGMKRAGYTVKWYYFQDLLQAYINAKKPAYGIWDRMKAENIFPSKLLSERLRQVDPFRKTSISDLLD